MKVPCLLKYLGTLLVENQNKIPTFLVENKKFSQNFVIAFEKIIFFAWIWIRNPDPD